MRKHSKFSRFSRMISCLLALLMITGTLLTAPAVVFATVNGEHTASSGEGATVKQESAHAGDEIAPGEVLVGLKYSNVEVRKMEIEFSGLDVAEIENLYESVVSLIPKEKINRDKLKETDNSKASFLVKLTDSSPEAVYKAIEILKKDPRVIYAEPNFLSYPEITTPNDPLQNNQWGMPKIGMPQVWDHESGDGSVEVGVLDTGIDFNHPDLASNIDVSKAFYAAQNTVGTRADVMDYDGHGTHVSGIIGAIGNNGLGVSGINWNVSIVPIKIALSNTTSASTNALQARAILYAATQDLSVINMSYSFSYSQTLLNALSAYDGLFVISAGNSSSDRDDDRMFVETHDVCDVIFVASAGQNDNLSSFSCYGDDTVAIAAPGDGIYSTMPVSMGSYGYKSGTSMASPHVAGAAALLMSAYPNESVSRIKSRLLYSADKAPALSAYVTTGGRLNAYRALNSTADIMIPGQFGESMSSESGSTTFTIATDSSGYYSLNIYGSKPHNVGYVGVAIYDSNGSPVCYANSSNSCSIWVNAYEIYTVEAYIMPGDNDDYGAAYVYIDMY